MFKQSIPRTFFALLLSLGVCLVAADASAAEGDPDLSFGLDGAVLVSLDPEVNTRDVGFAVHELADGNVLAFFRTAVTSPPGREDLTILRLLPDGAPDESFGVAGRVDMALAYFSLVDALVDSQGRMLIAGSRPTGATSFSSLFRLLPDGTLDTSFSSDGFSGIDWSNVFDGPSRLMISSDGSIWMVGSLGDPAVNQDLYVAKFNGEDGAFLFGSFLRIDRVTNGRDFGTGLAEDSSGRILVLGSSCFSSLACDGMVLRISANGTLDTSFAAAQTPRCRYNQVGAATSGCGLFGLFGARELFYDARELSSGDLLLAGRSMQSGQSTRGLLLVAHGNGAGLLPENEAPRRSGPLGTEFSRLADDSMGRLLIAGAGGAMRLDSITTGDFDSSFSSSAFNGGRVAPAPSINGGPGTTVAASFNDRDQIYLAGSKFLAETSDTDGFVGRLGPTEVPGEDIFGDGFETALP